RLEVSQYRLVAHLALALAIYGVTLWIALGLLQQQQPSPALRERGERSRQRAVAGRSGIRLLTPALSPGGGEGVTSYWRRAGGGAQLVGGGGGGGYDAVGGVQDRRRGFCRGDRRGPSLHPLPVEGRLFSPRGVCEFAPFGPQLFRDHPGGTFPPRAAGGDDRR